jgi:hypothetical protein
MSVLIHETNQSPTLDVNEQRQVFDASQPNRVFDVNFWLMELNNNTTYRSYGAFIARGVSDQQRFSDLSNWLAERLNRLPTAFYLMVNGCLPTKYKI